MKEKVQVLANSYVRAKEQTDLQRYADEAQDACIKADGCGCFQCVKRAGILLDRFQEESWRVNVWSPDQEEEWIADQHLPDVKD